MSEVTPPHDSLSDQYKICERFRPTSDLQNDIEVFSPVSPISNADTQKINWLDQYINAHRIAEENLEFMRKWLLKIPLTDLLTELNENYVGKMDAFTCEDDRRKIQENIEGAILDDDVRYLVYAYTAPTAFFRQLNRDLAKRGSTFRFESQLFDRSEDDQVPSNLGEYIFTACVIHHPSVECFYHPNWTTYRGVNMIQSELEQYVPDARILVRSFLSTSKNVNVPKIYLDLVSGTRIPVLCVYHITQSHTAMSIEEVSQFNEEEEVLIRPFAVFRVVKVEKGNLDHDQQGRVVQVFLEELPSTIERWEINNIQLNKNSFTDSYDSQGRLTSVQPNLSHAVKPTIDISNDNENEEVFEDRYNLLEIIQELIESIIPMLSRNKTINTDRLFYFESIRDFLTRYILDDYIWSFRLLKRLHHNLISIKQLLEEHENGKNYDVDCLNILLTRIEQRANHIDLGMHFKEDGPCIIEQLEYEDILDKRQKRKQSLESLLALNDFDTNRCLSYVKTCVEFHSNIHITGIHKNKIEQLATRLNLMPMTADEKKYFSAKCNPLVIPLQSFVSCSSISSNVSTMESQRHSLIANVKQQTMVNDSRDLYRLIAETPFLPSSKFTLDSSSWNRSTYGHNILDIMDKYRWIVILGDPGSAKTTLTRWLTLLCAKNFLENRTQHNNLSARLPILVRVGEIANALDRNPSVSLIDCLCQPTWFGTPLIQVDHSQSFLREYIKHGYALIILDGLDEIPDFRQRQHIVRLIEQFLQEWTICPVTNIAPFDKYVSGDQIEPLSCSLVGNQVIITSRIVGYYLCPLASHRIQHCVLSPLSPSLMYSFIDHWFQNLNSSLKISKWTSNQTITNLSVLGDELKFMLTKNEELQKLASNPMMITVLCTLNLIQPLKEIICLRKQRICLLDSLSQFTLQSALQPTEELSVVLNFIIDIAVYLHKRSPSGLVEELDLKNVLRKSIENEEDTINSFIRLIDSETCLLVPRGLCIYGFSHLLYEEYYVCLRILSVNDCVLSDEHQKCIAKQFCQCILCGSRFREPLMLALSYISWKWTETDYNAFCNSLLNENDTNQFSDPTSLGAICLLTSISELVQLPSTEVLRTLLDQCILASVKNQWFSYFPTFTAILRKALNELPLIIVHEWFLNAADEIINAVGQFILQLDSLPVWLDHVICAHLWSQLTLTNHRLSCCLFPFIAGLDKTLLPENDLGEYMIANGIRFENIHPLIFTVIICLCGGLTRSETDQDIVIFSPEWMYRQSDYSSILIQNLYSDPQALLNYSHDEYLSKSTSSSVDLLIMYCCLQGCKDEMLTAPLIQRLHELALDVCNVYLGKKYALNSYKPSMEKLLSLLTPLIDNNRLDDSFCSPSLITILALSRLLSVRETNFPNVNLPYQLSVLDEEDSNNEWYAISRSFQPDLIPASYRHLLLSTQSLPFAHRSFLSAAYIIELSLDAYQRWRDLNIKKSIFAEDSIQKALTFPVAQWIHTKIQQGNEDERHQLSQALYRCRTFEDAKTGDILNEWLCYDTNSTLREFAYHAAFLLFNLNTTATVLCYQLLGSEFDDFRRRSEELFMNNVVSSECLGHRGLDSLIEIRRNHTILTSPHVLESFNSLQIRLENRDYLDRLLMLLEDSTIGNILQSFSFIFDPSIQEYFIIKLRQCHTAAEDYIAIMLKIFARSKGEWDRLQLSEGIKATFLLFRKNSNSIQIVNTVLEIFIRWKMNNYIYHIITQSYYSENTRTCAIRFLYTSNINKSFYKALIQAKTETSSSLLVDAARESIIFLRCAYRFEDCAEPDVDNLLEYCSDDHFELFRSLVSLLSDSMYLVQINDSDEYVLSIFEKICIEHESKELDTVFIDIICAGLINTQNNPFSTLSDTHLAITLKYIEKREVEFFRGIQNSRLREEGFKNSLISISKKGDIKRRLDALNLLAYYGEMTIDIAKSFLDFSQENFPYQKRACGLIWRLKRIYRRETSEYLLEKLSTTKSLQQRYIIALLLVQLAINDQISTNTVCKYIKNVINDPSSSHEIYITSDFFTFPHSSIDHTIPKGRLDHVLAALFMQFSFTAGQPFATKSTSYSHYIDFYTNYKDLFKRIQEAPKLVSEYYKNFHHIDHRDDADDDYDNDVNSETVEALYDDEYLWNIDCHFYCGDHFLTEEKIADINDFFNSETRMSHGSNDFQNDHKFYCFNHDFEVEDNLSDCSD